MQLPSLLYGPYAQVASAVRKAITKIARGSALSEAFAGDLVDVQSVPGLLLLAGPNPLLSNDRHFQLYLPHSMLSQAIARKRIAVDETETLFHQSLQADWSLLGLASQPNVIWVYSQHRHAPFLNAVEMKWESFEAVGPKYSVGLATGQLLWNLPSNIKYALFHSGVPETELNSPLPLSGIKGLLCKYRIKT